MVKSKITVAKYLEQQLAVCGKSQREIAQELGYNNSNIITMFKNGLTKVPLGKAGSLAKAINVDPAFFLKLVMSEYMPDTWQVVEEVFGEGELITDQDRMVATFVREATGNLPLDLEIEENRNALRDAVRTITARDQAKAAAAVKRHNAMPPNSRNK